MTTSAPSWRTSSYGHTADTSPAELTELGDHLRSCRAPSGLPFALRCGVEAVHRFVAGRIVTTLVVVVVLIVVAGLAF